jgi:hypothetical protein
VADYTVRSAKHATFTPGEEDRVSFIGLGNGDKIEVTNRSGDGEVFYTIDGTTAAEVAGDDSFVLVAAVGASRPHAVNVIGDANEFRIHLISATAVDYTVTRLGS